MGHIDCQKVEAGPGDQATVWTGSGTSQALYFSGRPLSISLEAMKTPTKTSRRPETSLFVLLEALPWILVFLLMEPDSSGLIVQH